MSTKKTLLGVCIVSVVICLGSQMLISQLLPIPTGYYNPKTDPNNSIRLLLTMLITYPAMLAAIASGISLLIVVAAEKMKKRPN